MRQLRSPLYSVEKEWCFSMKLRTHQTDAWKGELISSSSNTQDCQIQNMDLQPCQPAPLPWDRTVPAKLVCSTVSSELFRPNQYMPWRFCKDPGSEFHLLKTHLRTEGTLFLTRIDFLLKHRVLVTLSTLEKEGLNAYTEIPFSSLQVNSSAPWCWHCQC